VTQVKSILLIRLKSIGDVVLTLPAVSRMRDSFPGARIAYLTSRENAAVVELFPGVDEIITLDRAALRRPGLKGLWAGTVGLVRRLRRGRFRLCIDLQGYGETAWLTRLSGAPLRWGSVYRQGSRWAYTCGVDRDDSLHPADWHLALLHRCGLADGREVRNAARVPPGSREIARQFFVSQKLDPFKPTLFIQPFTSSPQKDWPLEKHLAVARHWQAVGLQVIFGGGPADRAALEPARQSGFTVSAGVPLATTASLISQATLVLGPDTGVMHLAVALGRRVVMLIRPNGPGTPVPYQHADWAVNPPASGAVQDIEVDEVIAAVERGLTETKTPGT
jgi:ADP-heptose:LPS heptosyltransferase